MTPGGNRRTVGAAQPRPAAPRRARAPLPKLEPVIATLALPSRRTGALLCACITSVLSLGLLMPPAVARALSPSSVDLGRATTFAVLAGMPVLSTGPTAITGDVGVHPWPTVAGFPDGTISGGTYRADKTAIAAQAALVAAYYDAAGRASTAPFTALSGASLAPGVYSAGAQPLELTGSLVLDAGGDPSAVWILQTANGMSTAPSSTVELVNGAQACNVFWQVAGSAALGTGSVMVGTILAAQSITLGNSVTLAGRALARDGSVTLLDDVITGPGCGMPWSHAAPAAAGPTPTAAQGAFVNSAVTATSSPAGGANAGIGSYAVLIGIGVLVLAAVSMGEAPSRRRKPRAPMTVRHDAGAAL